LGLQTRDCTQQDENDPMTMRAPSQLFMQPNRISYCETQRCTAPAISSIPQNRIPQCDTGIASL
jgi:hypothetical protein